MYETQVFHCVVEESKTLTALQRNILHLQHAQYKAYLKYILTARLSKTVNICYINKNSLTKLQYDETVHKVHKEINKTIKLHILGVWQNADEYIW